MKKSIYILILLCCTITAQAQEEFKKDPVKDEKEVKEKLFNIDKNEENYFFKIALPEDAFLLIDFHRMSYWPESSDLQNISDIAAKTINSVGSSFKKDNVSRWVGIHVPVDNHPLTVSTKEHDDGSELMVISQGESAPLKVGMDTIRVLKTYRKYDHKERGEQLAQVQYTFILKDLNDIKTVADNKAILADVAHTLDSIVHQKRAKWHGQDVWYHKVWVDYKPMADEDKLIVKSKEPFGFLSGVDVDYYIGASVFRNTVTPYLEIGYSYKFPGSDGKFNMIRGSVNALPQFEKTSQSNYEMYSTSFINLEYGEVANKTRSRVPLYNYSIGFGYMFTDHPSLQAYRAGYKMFFHYGLSPAVRLTGDLYLMDRKGQENIIWSGLTVAFRLL